MAQDSDAIVIAGNGSVHVAPVGTALPTTHADALNAAFVDLGYINEDGATFSDDKTKEPIPVWQSFYPLRYVVTDASASIAFALRQWDVNTVPLAFGGGAVTDVAGPPAHFLYTPPDPEEIDERACVIEWAVDTYSFRLIIPKVMVTESVETNLTRTAASDLPITLGILGTDGASPWTIRTDHPSLDPA